ncbi:MAG: carboxypeptidase regulatory-like domain-containing protein [Gemmatimonadetes bacterium]|nr:carboxypeptidase regulatory-like domain-containing protein [Gemmatimonadota bacterium]MBI3504522.1 carboxypeptidase regulatory-like domain-containing protein [Pseudomonadota bacterium]
MEETTLCNPTLPRVIEVRTDSTGSYAVRGVPPLTDVYVVAYSSQFNSGMLVLAADSVPLRKQELVLGSPGQVVALRGRVGDSRQQPVANSTVEIDGLPGSATTDADGRFVLPAVPTGSQTLLARALGFTLVIQQVDVLQRGTEEVLVELSRTTRRPQVRVRGSAVRSPAAREYEGHKRIGFGAFLDSSQFVNRATTRSIFQGAAGITISNNDSQSISTFKIFMPYTLGYCEANVIVDGYRSDTEMLATIPKAQIAAVEIYLRPNELPRKYVPFDSICGTVVVWTKQAFAPPPAPTPPKAKRPER